MENQDKQYEISSNLLQQAYSLIAKGVHPSSTFEHVNNIMAQLENVVRNGEIKDKKDEAAADSAD